MFYSPPFTVYFICSSYECLVIVAISYFLICLVTCLFNLPFQNGDTPLHLAARGGHTNCMESLLTTADINVNIQDMVSCPLYCIIFWPVIYLTSLGSAFTHTHSNLLILFCI